MKVWRVFAIAFLMIYFALSLFWVKQLTGHDAAFTEVKGAQTSAIDSSSDLVSLINATRQKYNLPSLLPDPILTGISRIRTNDMLKREYYAHQDPDGKYFNDLMKRDGIAYDFACENLDIAFDGGSTTFVDDWLSSTKGHRECLLNPKVKKIGYSIVSMPLSGAANAQLAAVILSN